MKITCTVRRSARHARQDRRHLSGQDVERPKDPDVPKPAVAVSAGGRQSPAMKFRSQTAPADAIETKTAAIAAERITKSVPPVVSCSHIDHRPITAPATAPRTMAAVIDQRFGCAIRALTGTLRPEDVSASSITVPLSVPRLRNRLGRRRKQASSDELGTARRVDLSWTLSCHDMIPD